MNLCSEKHVLAYILHTTKHLARSKIGKKIQPRGSFSTVKSCHFNHLQITGIFRYLKVIYKFIISVKIDNTLRQLLHHLKIFVGQGPIMLPMDVREVSAFALYLYCFLYGRDFRTRRAILYHFRNPIYFTYIQDVMTSLITEWFSEVMQIREI